LTAVVTEIAGNMGKLHPGKDAGARTHGGHAKGAAATEKSGPGVLLDAAMCDGHMAPLKSRRPTAGADGHAVSKRRRVVKADSSEHDREQDGAPSPKSRFLGVHWNKCKKKWRVRIKIAGRDTHVGYFAEESEAALAFDR